MSATLSQKRVDQLHKYFDQQSVESKKEIVDGLLKERRRKHRITMSIKPELLESLSLDQFIREYAPTLFYTTEEDMMRDIHEIIRNINNKATRNTRSYSSQRAGKRRTARKTKKRYAAKPS